MLNKKEVYMVEDGRVFWSKEDRSWYFVYEGTFLTACANTNYTSDLKAARTACPVTRIAEEQAEIWVDEFRMANKT